MKTPVNERFQRDEQFDSAFDRVPKLVWYPYVGQDFASRKPRIMVYAHNIPMAPESCKAKMEEWKAKDAWATRESIGEYTYCRGWWTKAFRYFVKAAVGLQRDYDENSAPDVTGRVDAFVRRISYINYIQGLVPSDSQLVEAGPDLIAMSKAINKEVLRILEITHCICWGKHVFGFLLNTEGYKVLNQNDSSLAGFGKAVIDTGEGRLLKLAKVYHPAMPSFRCYSTETQAFISDFIES